MIPLPPRGSRVLGALPAPFAASQVDGLPASVCRYDGAWLASTDAWSDRRLGHLRDGGWQPFEAPEGWARQPLVGDDGSLAVVVHRRNDDSGRLHIHRAGRWQASADHIGVGAVTDFDGEHVAQRDGVGHATALTADGELIRVQDGRLAIGTRATVALPAGATVTQLAPAPGRELLAAVVRRGSTHQTLVFSLRTGRPAATARFRGTVNSRPVWLDPHRVALVVERWPSLVPVVWHWQDDRREHPWPDALAGTVRSLAAGPDGVCAAAASTPWTARRLYDLADLGSMRLVDRPVRTAVVTTGDGQRLPCLIYEPSGEPRGTVCYFPGGPHEPMWAEHSAFSLAMNDQGWRVVRVNTRSSGLREDAYRPVAPLRYGVDDVSDALAVVDSLGEGPVVTMGMSYGGYLAAMAGERSDRCGAIVLLSGFLSRRDLDRSGHPEVRRFAREAFTATPDEPTVFTKPVFVAHGSADPRVPIDVVLAHSGRARAGFDVVELAGAGHAILSDQDASLTYPPLLDWMSSTVPPYRRDRIPAAHRMGDDCERLPT